MVFNKLKHYKRKLIHRSAPSISTKDISLFSLFEGFKFFYKQTEISKNIGLSFSWNDTEGNFHDVSKFKTDIITWNVKQLKVIKYLEADPDNWVEFDFQISDKHSFTTLITLNFKEAITNPKITLLVSNHYKKWVADIYEGNFPAIKAWLEVGLPEHNLSYVGVRGEKETDYISTILSFKDARHFLENSDKKLAARILCAEFNITKKQQTFEGKINFLKNEKEFSQYFLKTRKKKLLIGDN